MIYDIGVIGLGVMGTNIEKNMSRKGFKVVTFDFFEDVRKNGLNELNEEAVNSAETLESVEDNRKPPRNILMRVKAGEVNNRTIGRVSLPLEQGATLIKGGNEQSQNTRLRNIEPTKQE